MQSRDVLLMVGLYAAAFSTVVTFLSSR